MSLSQLHFFKDVRAKVAVSCKRADRDRNWKLPAAAAAAAATGNIDVNLLKFESFLCLRTWDQMRHLRGGKLSKMHFILEPWVSAREARKSFSLSSPSWPNLTAHLVAHLFGHSFARLLTFLTN